MQWIKSFFVGAVTVLVALFCAACAKEEAVEVSGLSVWCTVQPQAYFVERIGGGLVSAEVLVHPGQSPEMYTPSAAQVAQLARADVYFGIGMPIEAPLFERMESSMSGVRVVQTGGEIAAPCSHHGHDHGHHGHDHGDHDPHIWLDPVQMVDVVEHMRDTLIEMQPESAEVFRSNAEVLIAELVALDVALREQLAPYAGRAFFINHPALGHFSERYGLVQMSIEQSGTAPSAARVADLIAQAREAQVGAIYTQPEFGRTTATILADALGVPVVEVVLLPTDYIVGLTEIGNALEGGFSNE
ncbi:MULTISPECIES: metal ABC transporter solute-binding protein, Zn/Mn family [unclassified Lentimonas]|uniref:metal ABC transporter substrate-binding protein n=1 Tax=unclassified Lentimonas TaxID=2630993 RepID=UPI00138A0E77|nr:MULTISPECIES: zinc ABC transporter substrate-binding protein [unclassified Lentimonas]